MGKYSVRIDVAFTYEVEAESEEAAIDEAQNAYDSCDASADDVRIVETLAFSEEEE